MYITVIEFEFSLNMFPNGWLPGVGVNDYLSIKITNDHDDLHIKLGDGYILSYLLIVSLFAM